MIKKRWRPTFNCCRCFLPFSLSVELGFRIPCAGLRIPTPETAVFRFRNIYPCNTIQHNTGDKLRPQFPYPSLSDACHAGYEIRVFQDLHEARVKLLGSKGNSTGTVGRKGKKAKKKRKKRWKSITYSHWHYVHEYWEKIVRNDQVTGLPI